MERLIDTSLFLEKNCVSFRGRREKSSDENTETLNQGLFLELIKFLSKYDAVLGKHLSNSNKNETYLSRVIQNDIIKAMTNETLYIILNKIKFAKYFSIIIDSTIVLVKTINFL